MSTILKALRRLEREKSAQEDRPLKDEVTAAPAGSSRGGFPLLLLMIGAGVMGLALGASLLWLWPRMSAAPQAAAPVAQAPQPLRRAPGVVPPVPMGPAEHAAAAVAAAAPPAPAAQPAPAPPAAPSEPEAPPAPVASAPPEPVTPAPPPVAVVARPAPSRPTAPAPEAAAPPEPIAAKPAVPDRGSRPPFTRHREDLAKAVAPPAPAARVEKVVRAPTPEVLVSSTVWHPQRDRRTAMVEYAGGAPRELHEGDAIGPLVVSEIGPSSVTFLQDGVELRRRVGAKD